LILLALGFVVFFVGGALFQKGGVDRSPGETVVVSAGVHALSISGITLMVIGALTMVAAGI
jgi:hypothetical protein